MDYEFLGSFSAADRTRIKDALGRLRGPRVMDMPPHWTVFNTPSRGARRYMAVSHRATLNGTPTGQPCSFHGETAGELVEAICARAAVNAP